MQCGALWYRGGVYKFSQLITLLVPAMAWTAVAILVTVNGLELNKIDPLSAVHIALLCTCWLTFALLSLATILRAVEKGGKATQAVLDAMEAQARADAAITHMRKKYGDESVRHFGVADIVLQDEMARLEGRYYVGGFDQDDVHPEDEVYIARHPMW